MELPATLKIKVKRYLYFILLVVVVSSCSVSQKAGQVAQGNQKAGTFTNLGVQLKSINRQAAAFVQDNKGAEYAYLIIRGRPGHLVGYHMATQQVVVDIELEAAEGAIDMVSTDNWLYIGASNGHLMRTRAGSQEIEDLGLALGGTSEILDLVSGKDGEIFGGTFPTGKVFRYHPKDGFADIVGQVVSGESYVRSLAYQHSTGKLFAGIGSHAHLIEIDPQSGNKKNILPAKYADREFIYYMSIAEGVDGGDRILAWATNPKDRETLVINAATGKLEQVIETLYADAILKSKTSNDIYFTAGNDLFKKDFTKVGQESIRLAGSFQAKQMRWGNDGTLHIITKYGEVKTYNPESGKMTSIKIDVNPLPYGIQTLITGPDDRIWSSGYLHGGNAAYNPRTNESIAYKGLGQAEGMFAMGNKIYFGIYPQSRFYSVDVTKPWDTNRDNPHFIGKIEGQDRPFAIAGLEDLEKVYFGTIPGYGKLGGALIEYNLATEQLEPFVNVIQDQSIASLLYSRKLVWGGTTIFGGLGAKPTQQESKLFAWDPISKTKVFEFTPVAGTMAITSLIEGPEGNIWGLADGVLFVFDPASRKVIATTKLFDIQKNPTHIWRVGFLQLHPSGFVYGTANGDFFRIDPKSMEVTTLKEGMGLLAMDSEGVLYMRDTENLWSYKP